MNKNFIKDSLTIFVDVEKNYQEASIVSSDNPPIFSTIPHWDVLPYSATGYVFRYGYRDYVSFSLEDDCRRLVSNQIGLQIIEPIANNRVIKISSDQYSMTYYRKYREPYPRSGIFVWSPTESDTMMFQYEPFSQFGGDFIPVPMIYDLQSE